MTKLELKHIAPYLPYGLGFATQSGKSFKSKCTNSFEIRIVKGRHPSGSNSYHSLTLDKINRGEFKPLFRQLSQLTKDEGEYAKFIAAYGDKNTDLDYLCECVEDVSNDLSYDCMVYLFENHYDVFGLIEKGLAEEKI